MDNSKSIDYNSKVLDFMAMTETGDPEIATKYLEATNWDETAAVNQFFSKIRVNNNFNNDNIMRDELNINNSNNNNILNRNLINNHNNNRNNNTDEDQGFISKYFLAPIRALLGA